MSEAELDRDEICTRFSKLHWHDSKLLDLHLLRVPGKRKYDLRLDLDLIIAYAEGEIERNNKSAIFRECRIVQMDLDLLGVVICGGDIGSATCYADAVELERENREKARQFGFPQSYNPLEKCLGFFIEMINPGGEIIVFAKDFELV
jgi:hypothetical protein